MNPKVSSFCSSGGCVQVSKHLDGWVAVGDSNNRAEQLVFTADEWADFVAGVKNGEFDLEAL